MFLRIDRLQIELPQPTNADPNSAAALQELLGGKFGEMFDPEQLLLPELQLPQ